MNPAEVIATQDRKSGADSTTAPAAAQWLNNPTTPEERPMTQAELWAAEPQWTDPAPESKP